MADETIAVTRSVHYVARGSADGVYPPVCRAAVITAADGASEGVVELCVFNPTGLFFNKSSRGSAPGEWHFYTACPGEDAA